jgi:hypothetical protein
MLTWMLSLARRIPWVFRATKYVTNRATDQGGCGKSTCARTVEIRSQEAAGAKGFREKRQLERRSNVTASAGGSDNTVAGLPNGFPYRTSMLDPVMPATGVSAPKILSRHT